MKSSIKRVAIVANRSSGREAAVAHTFQSRTRLWGRELEYHFPNSVDELRATCAKISANDYEALITIGGDGTVNQALRSFQTTPNEVPLYPFPGGTANDLAKELGLKSDWDQVQDLLDRKQHEQIDLIEVNGSRFATVGGVGIGSIFTQEFNQRRCQSLLFKALAQLFHFQFYTLLSVKTILMRRNYTHHLHIRAAGFDEKIRTPAVFFCNQAYLGGNVKVAPPIDNNDKKFNVLIINPGSKVQILRSMAQSKAGKLPPHCFAFSTDHVTITDLDQRPLSVFGDGETLTESSHLEIKILPKSLWVYREKPLPQEKRKRMFA